MKDIPNISLPQSKAREHSCIALFSGGLDSVLAVKWMQLLGYNVQPVFFSAPYIVPDKAVKTAKENGLQLIVRNITSEHLEMMKDPVYGFGKNFNPCIDCHALMFQMAGELLKELKADFIISGEVLAQRPMSQRHNALLAVNKLSGVGDLIIRPLSQKLLADSIPVSEGWVDKAEMLDIQGRGRSRQMELAKMFGLIYPSPGGGCLLTDRNFTLRMRELAQMKQFDDANIRLLRWGRHLRLRDGIKLIIGRDESDNNGIEAEHYPGVYFKIRDREGPLGLLTSLDPSDDLIALAASIVLAYSTKAASPGYVKYGVDIEPHEEILVEKCFESIYRPFLITLDKEL